MYKLQVQYFFIGRKGAPGSGILILYDANSCHEEDLGRIFDLKEERNRRETLHINTLKNEFHKNVKIQENCFRKFSEHYTTLKSGCKNNGLSQDISSNVCLSALDSWAFWVDSYHAQGFENLSQTELLHQLDLHFKHQRITPSEIQNEAGYLTSVVNFFSPSISGPSVHVSNDVVLSLITTPSRQISFAKFLMQSGKQEEFFVAEKIFDGLIKTDEFWYPAAHYYKAYIIVNKTLDIPSNKSEILYELFAAENVITKHVEMQMSFSAIVSNISAKEKTAFFPVEAYKKQKENQVYILELFNNSIATMVGKHCQEEGLVAAGLDEKKAEKAFKFCIKNNFVKLCKANPTNRVPNYEDCIKSIGFDYGIEVESIKNILSSASNKNEKELEIFINKSEVFQQSRKSFWNKLKQFKALTDVEDVVGVEADKVQEFGLDAKDQICTQKFQIWFEPQQTKTTEVIYFRKNHIKSNLGIDYQKKKRNLLSNKLAKLNIETLKEVQQKLGTRLTKEELINQIQIDESDANHIWKHLIKNEIIQEDGVLLELKDRFQYNGCPMLEKPLQTFLDRKFVEKRICQSWLNDCGRNNTDIAALLNKPYRGLLDDLFRERLILPPHVPDDDTVDLSGDGMYNFIKNKVWADEFHEEFPESKDRDTILNYLRGNQASYANLDKSAASLKPLAEQIQQANTAQKIDNISTELAKFQIIGFDEIIVLHEKKWSKKMIFKAVAVLAFGIIQVAVGMVIQLKSAGLMTHVAAGFISEGVSDLIFALSALKSGNNFTWGDYGRHKIESILITTASIGVGCLLSKGVKFFQHGFKAVGPAVQGATTTTSVVALGWKELAIEASKLTLIKVAKAASMSLVNQGVHVVVSQYLRKYCQEMGDKLYSYLQERLRDIQELKETLRNLFQKFGSQANKMVQEILSEMFTSSESTWLNTSAQMFTKVMTALSVGIGLAVEKRQSATAVSNAIVMASKIMYWTQTIMDGLKWLYDAMNLIFLQFGTFQEKLKNKLTSAHGLEATDHSDADCKNFVGDSVEQFHGHMANQAS